MARSGCLSGDLLAGGGLELVGSLVAQGAVQPGAVVPGDVVHGGPACRGPGGPRLQVQALALERREERFGQRVIPALPGPAARQPDLEIAGEHGIVTAGVLAAAVGVEDHPGPGITRCDGNSLEHRWTLRERGIILAGPRPKGLVEKVDPEAIRQKMRQLIQTFLPELAAWIRLDSIAWAQRYAVATLCRMLYSIATGEMASKRAALLWAKEHLDPAWSDLSKHALAGRHRGWNPNDLPSNESVQQTIAFAEYAKAWATAT
jgi:hypothetical protein